MLRRIKPNHLTTLRLILTPLVMYFLRWDQVWAFALCLVLMAVSEATDFLDGYVARKYGKVTDFGKIYDPMCDAIYHQMIFLCLMLYGLPIGVMAIFIVRDLAVGYSRTLCANNGYVLSARWSGKCKAVLQMAFQFIFVTYLLVDVSGSASAGGLALSVLGGCVFASGIAAVFVTVYSLLDYLLSVMGRFYSES